MADFNFKLPSPVKGPWVVTRTAAEHESWSQKKAVDFGERGIIGAHTVANFAGRVRFAGYDGGQFGAGWLVEVEGEVAGHQLVAGWCHHGDDTVADGGTLQVATWDWVEVGAVLGLVGWSGYVLPKSEQGAHLHYRLDVDGVRVDPEDVLDFDLGGDDVDDGVVQVIVDTALVSRLRGYAAELSKARTPNKKRRLVIATELSEDATRLEDVLPASPP